MKDCPGKSKNEFVRPSNKVKTRTTGSTDAEDDTASRLCLRDPKARATFSVHEVIVARTHVIPHTQTSLNLLAMRISSTTKRRRKPK